MIGRAARERRHGTVEIKFREVQLVDKGIYDPFWLMIKMSKALPDKTLQGHVR
jgi:hypothetical protein